MATANNVDMEGNSEDELEQQLIEASVAGPSTSTTPFKLPANPSIPQDLSIIAELVNTHQVVGSLPPLAMSAAEKRKLVEQSIKAKALEREAAGAKGMITNDQATQSGKVDEDDSDWSSEYESDAEEAKPAVMSTEERDAIKTELDKLVGEAPQDGVNAGGEEDGSESDSDSDSSSYMTNDEDEDDLEGKEFEFSGSPLPSPLAPKLQFEYIDDDEDVTSGDPILSVNEQALPPVPVPKMARIPEEEKLALAGEVVSWMREKRVEAYWAEQRAGVTEEHEGKEDTLAETAESEASTAEVAVEAAAPENAETPATPAQEAEGDGPAAKSADAPVTTSGTVPPTEVSKPPSTSPQKQSKIPSFGTSGTVVIRAMQERPGEDGWLEEGSLVCFSDGRILGQVADTFGPLFAPFYSVRLPPPPHPYPSLESLSTGSRLYYPRNPAVRGSAFVDMLAVRDPRFKGSDASNVHDEEVGEDEMEWSDDEAEAEYKARKKRKRADSVFSNASTATASGAGGKKGKGKGKAGLPGGVGLPSRPHFDYTPDDGVDGGSMYGQTTHIADGVSDAGSTRSNRPAPLPYELDDDMAVGGQSATAAASSAVEAGAGGGHDGRARGQGRSTGGGRGGERGARGGGRGGRGGRGGARGGNHATTARQAFGLPSRPDFNHSATASSTPHSLPQAPVSSYTPSTTNPGILPIHPPTQYTPLQPVSRYVPPSSSSQAPSGAPSAAQHSNSMPLPNQQMPMGGQSTLPNQTTGADAGPAINPRFAAQMQYQQMQQQMAQMQQYQMMQQWAWMNGMGGMGGQGQGQG